MVSSVSKRKKQSKIKSRDENNKGIIVLQWNERGKDVLETKGKKIMFGSSIIIEYYHLS